MSNHKQQYQISLFYCHVFNEIVLHFFFCCNAINRYHGSKSPHFRSTLGSLHSKKVPLKSIKRSDIRYFIYLIQETSTKLKSLEFEFSKFQHGKVERNTNSMKLQGPSHAHNGSPRINIQLSLLALSASK